MTVEKIETTDSEVKTLSNGDLEIVNTVVSTETTIIEGGGISETAPAIEIAPEIEIEKEKEIAPWELLQSQLSTLILSVETLTEKMTQSALTLQELQTLTQSQKENAADRQEAEKIEPYPILDTEPEPIPIPEPKEKAPVKAAAKSRRWL